MSEKKFITVNLLRPEKKDVSSAPDVVSFSEEGKGRKINIAAALLAVIITLGTLVFFYLSQTKKIEDAQNLLKEKQARLAELEHVRKRIDEIENTKRILENKIKLISELKMHQKDAMIMMDQLSRSLPEWVWLTKLNCSGNAVTLEGRAVSYNLIADLIVNLQNTNYFKNVKMQDTKRIEDAFEFKISCQFSQVQKPSKVG